MYSEPRRFSIRKRDAKKRVKIVRDREAGLTLERVKASADRYCLYEFCPFFMNTIEKGTEYAKVLNPDRAGIFLRGQTIPVFEDFHFECVPNRAKPLAEFYKEVS